MKSSHDLPSRSTLPSPRLELRHLRLVQAIAAERGVTRAAARLHLSQSAVSHQLVDLERDLETRLFDRVGKRMVPTAAGARILQSAERIVAEVAQVEREVRGAPARLPLRVATSCYTSYHWLPHALARLAATHSNVDVEIVLEATRRAIEALDTDEVDVSFVGEPPRNPAYARERLFASELVVVAQPAHPLVARAKERGALRWSDLVGYELMVHDLSNDDFERLRTSVKTAWEKRSGQRLSEPVVVRRVSLTEAIVGIAGAGLGIGVVDRWTVAPYLAGGGVAAIPIAPHAERVFWAVWREANPRRLPVDDLLRAIRSHVRDSPEGALPKRKKPSRR